MRKLLKKLFIIQEKESIDSFKITRTLRRVNPYNPLSYLAMLITILLAIILYGFIGAWKETDLFPNPFNWR